MTFLPWKINIGIVYIGEIGDYPRISAMEDIRILYFT